MSARLYALSRLLLLLCWAATPLPTVHAQTIAIRGSVQDASGAAIMGASVHLVSSAWDASVKTNSNGQFLFAEVPVQAGSVDVVAPGFVKTRQSWNSNGQDEISLNVTLPLARVSEQIVVSAARTADIISELPVGAVLLSSEDVAATPALRIDDLLRQVPGFSLFRRSGSRTANPTAQGVWLRGLGGSASSRTLVLADGISLLDPFGAWVYWDRVPRAAISSIEVFRGGDSNLYGSSALGGVVAIRTRESAAPGLFLEGSLGNERTPELSIWTGSRFGPWHYSVASEMFRTDGFILVPNSIRGSVDTPANAEDATVYAQLGHQWGSDGRIFARGNFYTGSRNNGTRLQVNDTRIGEAAFGLDRRFGNDATLTMRLSGDVGAYNQVFSSVAPDRNSETLTDVQHVPEQLVSGGVQWTQLVAHNQTLIGGADLNEVIGASQELLTGTTRARDGGGRQRSLGVFGEDLFRPGKWTVILGARLDYWNNFKGTLTTTPANGPPIGTIYPDRTELALSPRVSVLRNVNQHLSLNGAGYRAFRAPTLNELYRTFRVGNALTLNNATLEAERLTGAEAGAHLIFLGGRLLTRGTAFWNQIVNPIANVTLSNTPTLITRKKENLGKTRSVGVELDETLRFPKDIQVSVGYAFTDATVVSYPENPGGVDLVGLDISQVPRNVFTWQALYRSPSTLLLSLTGRFVGRQFDDDQNKFPLDRFYTMDLQLGRAITRNVELFCAVENILNQRYEVAKTPIVNLGPPVLYRFGVRLSLPGSTH